MAYEFFVTGILYDRSQTALLSSFQQGTSDGTLSDAASTPAEGDAIALIKIPRLGVDSVVVEGTSPEDLKSGPGHFRGSPRPGEFGNAVIAGRRTTYGSPFGGLNNLVKGDKISVTTGQGIFEYVVTDVYRTGAGSADPLNGTLDSRLTLITSDPAFVPDGRLAVVATLHGEPVDVPNRGLTPVSATDLGLTGDSVGLGVALLWGVLLAAAILALTRFTRSWPMRVRYLVGAPIVLTLSLLLVTNIDRVLPGTL